MVLVVPLVVPLVPLAAPVVVPSLGMAADPGGWARRVRGVLEALTLRSSRLVQQSGGSPGQAESSNKK